MTMRCLVVAVAATLLGCGPALAQVSGSPIGTTSPLGMTSPLGIGPGAAVAPTGIPMGATELVAPGTSPMTFLTSPTGGNACGTTTIGPFDGGGTSAMASTTCPPTGTSPPGTAAASASSPTAMGATSLGGPIGIPMGSTELAGAGTSPPPVVPIPNPAPPVMPGPTTTMASPSAPLATSGSTTAPCLSSGVFTPNGIITTPGTTVTSSSSLGSC